MVTPDVRQNINPRVPVRGVSRVLSPACAAGLLALASPLPLGFLAAAADPTDGTITVVVVRDADGDGRYDPAGDPPQRGIGVTVTDAGGKSVTGTTGETGEVVVRPTGRLTGGRYFVTAEVPDDLGLAPVPESPSFAASSSTVDVTSESQTVRLGVAAPTEQRRSTPPPSAPPPPPAPRPATSAGPRFAVGDRVWHDLNRQGTQDAAEPAASRTSVQLLDSAGNVVSSTRTDAAGRYLFDDLPAGRYSVRFAGVPTGSKLSPAGVGGAAADSDPDYSGVTPPFSLDVGQPNVRKASAGDRVRATYINPTVDAGIAVLTYAVGSVVWQDINGDGVLDPHEPPGQAKVSLLDRRGDEVGSTRTDDQGRFLFANLASGTYRLRFSELGAHRQLTTARAGGSPGTSSAADPADGTTAPFELKHGASDLLPASDFGDVDADFVKAGLNAGTVGSYAITNRVWRDTNGDGLSASAEPGVAGVRVQLLDAKGAVVAGTTTNRSGRYAFNRLTAGAYQLRFSRLPAGLFFTAAGVGDDRSRDSDVYGNAVTAPITVGEDHPVEAGVAAGLTTAAATAESAQPLSEPSASPLVAAEAAAPARSRTAALGWSVGTALALLAAGLVTYRRLRPPTPRRRGG